MKETPNLIARLFIGALSLMALFGVVPVSLAELSAGNACPHLGPIPACHIVSLAYATMLIVVLHARLWNPWVFLIAWAPIFLFAATGSTLELFGYETCPKTAGGIPKCYFSLELAIALILPMIVLKIKSKLSEVDRMKF